jgi:hypothetical protein
MVNERLIYIATGTKSVTNQVFALIARVMAMPPQRARSGRNGTATAL